MGLLGCNYRWLQSWCISCIGDVSHHTVWDRKISPSISTTKIWQLRQLLTLTLRILQFKHPCREFLRNLCLWLVPRFFSNGSSVAAIVPVAFMKKWLRGIEKQKMWSKETLMIPEQRIVGKQLWTLGADEMFGEGARRAQEVEGLAKTWPSIGKQITIKP